MNSAFSTIRLLLLDADGVIQGLPGEWLRMAEDICGDPTRTDEFLREFYATEKLFMTGDKGVEDALAKLLVAWNSPSSIEVAKQLWWRIDKKQEIIGIASMIRASGTQTALASNQQLERAGYMSKELGYAEVFDECYYSCHLGFAKPDPEYFSSVIDQSGVPASEILFVDDQEMNIDAARSLGINAECFHFSEGVEAFSGILEMYGIYDAQQGAAVDRCSASLHSGN